MPVLDGLGLLSVLPSYGAFPGWWGQGRWGVLDKYPQAGKGEQRGAGELWERTWE